MSEVGDLLWIDLETTGSSEEMDEILEVACIATSGDLVEYGTFESVVQPSDAGFGRLSRNDFVKEMHTTSGLITEIFSAPDIREVDAQIYQWLTGLNVTKKLTLAGSGVAHFDSRFIRKYMKITTGRLNYFTIDTGVLRRSWRLWVGTEVSNANDGKTHRAMDDIKCHLEEARAFKEHWNIIESSWDEQ